MRITIKKAILFSASLTSYFGQGLLGLLFPKFCLICGRYGYDVCASCFAKIELAKTYVCFECGKINSFGQICVPCKAKRKLKLSKIVWAASYQDEIVKTIIHSFKYDGLIALGDILSEMLVQRLLGWKEINKNLIIVPVPLHVKKYKLRGFNQAEVIARYLSKRLDLHGGLALKRVKNTKSQVGLDRKSRQENMTGSFACIDRELITKKNVLLIDDVATTGATLNECAKVLIGGGAKRVFAAVIARD